MSLSIQINAGTPQELIDAITSLAAAFGGPAAFGPRVEVLNVELPPNAPSTATVKVADPAPVDPPTPEVKANVVKELTPAEMRQKGSDLLLGLFNKDPTTSPTLSKIQSKYNVKKFSEISDDKAQEFYNEALLAANGTSQVSA